ncbi:MAG: phosphoribosyl-ATP diphosphatase [Anaerolineae bacterium]|nr:phosphoribosyl-ATP diphosphatase [Anaerolineae bacterium]
MPNFVDTLFDVIRSRQEDPAAGSYTAQLFAEGLPKITQKVGEEAVEVIVAAHSQSDERLVEEFADLVYHSLVLLAQRGLTPDDIRAELERRHR